MTDCVESLRSTTKDVELVIVDNGSPYLADEMSEWADTYIRNEKNQGYTKAVNTGVKHSTGNVVVIANDDIRFTEGWLEALLGGLQQAKIATCKERADELPEKHCKFGFLWAIKRKDWDKLGGLDDRFVNTFSDTDLFRRAKRNTIRVDHLVWHAESATLKTIDFNDRVGEYKASMKAYKDKYGEVD